MPKNVKKMKMKNFNHLSIQVSNRYVCCKSLPPFTNTCIQMDFESIFPFPGIAFILWSFSLVKCHIEVWKRIWLSFSFFSHHFCWASISHEELQCIKHLGWCFFFSLLSHDANWFIIQHWNWKNERKKTMGIYDMRLGDVEIQRFVFLRWIAFDW